MNTPESPLPNEDDEQLDDSDDSESMGLEPATEHAIDHLLEIVTEMGFTETEEMQTLRRQLLTCTEAEETNILIRYRGFRDTNGFHPGLIDEITQHDQTTNGQLAANILTVVMYASSPYLSDEANQALDDAISQAEQSGQNELADDLRHLFS